MLHVCPLGKCSPILPSRLGCTSLFPKQKPRKGPERTLCTGRRPTFPEGVRVPFWEHISCSFSCVRRDPPALLPTEFSTAICPMPSVLPRNLSDAGWPAIQVQRFAATLAELRAMEGPWAVPQGVAVHGVGHSNGALLHLLITSLLDSSKASNVIISFNNKWTPPPPPGPLMKRVLLTPGRKRVPRCAPTAAHNHVWRVRHTQLCGDAPRQQQRHGASLAAMAAAASHGAAWAAAATCVTAAAAI
jgi:Protein of unknown function (DUF1350)